MPKGINSALERRAGFPRAENKIEKKSPLSHSHDEAAARPGSWAWQGTRGAHGEAYSATS